MTHQERVSIINNGAEMFAIFIYISFDDRMAKRFELAVYFSPSLTRLLLRLYPTCAQTLNFFCVAACIQSTHGAREFLHDTLKLE